MTVWAFTLKSISAPNEVVDDMLRLAYGKAIDKAKVRATLQNVMASADNGYFADGGASIQEVAESFNNEVSGRQNLRNKIERPNVKTDLEDLCVSVETSNFIQLRNLLKKCPGYCVAVCGIKTDIARHKWHAVAAYTVRFGNDDIVEAKNSWGVERPVMEVRRENCREIFVVKPTLHWSEKDGIRMKEDKTRQYLFFLTQLEDVLCQSKPEFSRGRRSRYKVCLDETHIAISNNDDSYEGQMRDWKPHGLGTSLGSRGEEFSGVWVDGMKHVGRVLYAANDPSGRLKFEGRFTNDAITHGTMEWSCGVCYEGDFLDGKVTGRGTLKHPGRFSYEGEFRDGQAHGKGAATFLDGLSYFGDYKDGLPHGFGVSRDADGSTYHGEFKEANRFGKGLYKGVDGFHEHTYGENEVLISDELINHVPLSLFPSPPSSPIPYHLATTYDTPVVLLNKTFAREESRAICSPCIPVSGEKDQDRLFNPCVPNFRSCSSSHTRQ